MKKHHKKKDKNLIDLKARGSIVIVQSSRKPISSKEMQDFEKRFMDRYIDYCEFTESCIKKNIDKNRRVSIQEFHAAIQSMINQNTLLENMIDIEERDT